MRLIDADAFKEALGTDTKIREMFCRIIDEQPTAYNVDKVVDEIKEQTVFLEDCTKYGNKNAEQMHNSYSTMMMYEVAEIVDDLIDIVRNGGAE